MGYDPKSRDHAIFASIGPAMPDNRDPIKYTVDRYGARIIHLIGSDEKPLEDRGSSEDNYNQLKNRYQDLGIDVKFHPYRLNTLSESIYTLANSIISEILYHPNIPVIFDVTGGRMEMSYILSQAGRLALNMIRKYKKKKEVNPVGILCVIKPKGEQITSFWLELPKLMPAWTYQMLSIIENSSEQITDKEIGDKIGKDQTSISRKARQMSNAGFMNKIGHSKKVNKKGKLLLDLYLQLKDWKPRDN